MNMNCPTEFDLSGKIAVVTGASRGLGYQFSLALARHGATLVICSRTVAHLDELAQKIKALGRRVLKQRIDVTSLDDINHMAGDIAAKFGRIDILVNNSGINKPQWAEDVTEDNWDDIIATNLKGLFFCSQAVGRVMIRQKYGKIINISSDAGSVGLIKRAAYCASKGGVNQVTKVLAIEWARHNINVNAIAPAFIETPFTEPMFQDPSFRQYVLDNTPLGRVGKTSDVTGALIYLASPASDYVTGHTLLVDGGWTAK